MSTRHFCELALGDAFTLPSMPKPRLRKISDTHAETDDKHQCELRPFDEVEVDA